ncbi:MAG: hypothetical protein AAFX39_15370 [Pseudomonadota bacterium]
MESSVLAALIGFAGVVLTIAGTLGGTYLGTRLNRRSALSTAVELAKVEQRRYAEDRLWDNRRGSYTAIVAGLRSTLRLVALVNEGYNGRYEHPEEYHRSERALKQTRDFWKQWHKTKTEYEGSFLLLSDEIVSRFEQLEDELLLIDDEDAPPAVFSQYTKVFDKAFNEIFEIAKKEISQTRKPAQQES